MRALAEAFGESVSAEPEATIRVVLVLEELFTNTVAHGYPAGSEGSVWVSLDLAGNAIEITYEDAGPPFDPIGGAPAVPRPDEEQTLAGVGLALVRGLSASARYARDGDRNRVILTVTTGTAARPPPPRSERGRAAAPCRPQDARLGSSQARLLGRRIPVAPAVGARRPGAVRIRARSRPRRAAAPASSAAATASGLPPGARSRVIGRSQARVRGYHSRRRDRGRPAAPRLGTQHFMRGAVRPAGLGPARQTWIRPSNAMAVSPWRGVGIGASAVQRFVAAS